MDSVDRNNSHQRTIIHLDMDCFYAQVEEIRDPTLRAHPLGVQQKSMVVTCNYKARALGIRKLMSITEAKRICPTLVLVNGEDLTPYRQMSQNIFELLHKYTASVEKLGFDENFMDISNLVKQRLAEKSSEELQERPCVKGHVYPADDAWLSEACACGCPMRLALGTQIAEEIRDELYSKLGVTCCAGVSYNKLLAKLVGSQNKPNQQTVLVSSYAEQFMRELRSLSRITGIGQKTESLLLESGIGNIEELQGCDMDLLRKKFGYETAVKLKDLAFGRDTSTVRATGRPKSISLEDSCRPISVRTDVEDRFRLLLMRLIEQVAEDGRIPVAIKIILRKFDAQKKSSHRETKQANILPSLFKATSCTDPTGAKVLLADGAQEKLLKIVMRLFERIVDLKKPFNITLLGLAFSKFQQRKDGSSSIANFLIKKTDLEVQSVTSLTNTDVSNVDVASGITSMPSMPSSSVGAGAGAGAGEMFHSSPTTFHPSDQFYRRRTMAASPIPMLVDNGSESAATNSDFSDFSETEVEPSPKKSRIGHILMKKQRCFGNAAAGKSTDPSVDVASPSKLRVSDLRLNSRDSEKDFPMSPCNPVISSTSQNTSIVTSSTSVTATNQRFRTVQPPSTLLGHVDRMDGCRSTARSSNGPPSPCSSPMDDSIGSEMPPMCPGTIRCVKEENECVDMPQSSSPALLNSTTTVTTATITGNLANIPCPAGVDPQVFNELPLDVQNELIASWRRSLAAAAVAVANRGVSSLNSGGSTGSASSDQPQTANTAKAESVKTNGTQKNTLYRYFLRNK